MNPPTASLATDIAVIGAGPTGATAAIAFARRGARVLLVDGHPKAAHRFAGEWVHPPGVLALQSLGIDTRALASGDGHGLALFGDDGQDPVCLPYEGGMGLYRVHSELVGALRDHACGFANVTYLPEHTLSALEGNRLTLEDRRGQRLVSVVADRIIGADGRSSKARALLGADSESNPLSYMAGLELLDAKLPFEGMGHVFVGGPGPALVYRLDACTVRVCLDLPDDAPTSERQGRRLYEAFARVLPPQLLPAFRRATEGRIAWAATRFRQRAFYGKDPVWLAGDATGHLHPLSGVGITLGMLDAVEAARAPSLAAYQEARAARVVELLSSVLYLAFARHDASAVRVRRGVFRMLRSSPRERSRTMRLLTGADKSGTSFASSFLRATGHVVASGVERTATRRQSISDLVQQVREDAVWLKWPLDACVPLARLRQHTLGSNGEASLPRRSLQP